MYRVMSLRILESVLCKSCEKYYSAGPIKIYPDKSIKCRRCSIEDDLGRESLCNILLEQYLFPCVNIYDGCDELLTLKSVFEHEKNCQGGVYNCPFKDADFTGSAYEMRLHFQKCHSKYFVTKKPFQVNTIDDRELHYLFVHGNFIFIISTKYSIDKHSLCIKSSILRSNEEVNNITFYYKLVSMDSDLPIVHDEMTLFKEAKILLSIVETNILCNIDFNMNETHFYHQPTQVEYFIWSSLKLPADFRYNNFEVSACGSKIVNRTLNVVLNSFCDFCHYLYIKREIYSCEDSKHFICGLCFNIQTVCSDGKSFVQNESLGYFYKQLQFGCKWNCGYYYEHNEIIAHELECKNSGKIECPVKECHWFSDLSSLNAHFKHAHASSKIHFDRMIFSFLTKVYKKIYLVLHHNYIVVLRTKHSKTSNELIHSVKKCFPICNRGRSNVDCVVYVNNELINSKTFTTEYVESEMQVPIRNDAIRIFIKNP